MTKQELIQKLSIALEGTQGKGSRTKYICFSPFKKEFRIVHNSNLVRRRN